ncbi:hypothetical protein D929_02748 [Enterococcus faecalis 02-MB-P-10]|uniref:DUF2087 domain-containing protein n=1 Tax=Enterococcus faecalis TaxID=1351 RepID=UPI000353E8B0|nr:DUF2087 domain-containing protein [Enterococcus faecalis]EPH68650.1 hypothetical protein D929_02748 [Enterococcus faecalis 02-MB-P-10]
MDNRFFNEEGELQVIPKKSKAKIEVFSMIIELFECNRLYTESEVNDVLKKVYSDYVLLRRYLIEYKFLSRDLYGREYERVRITKCQN